MTSAFEGFPMTLVEAEQFGCVPIVMDSFSSLSSIITDGKNERIIANHDEDGFLSAMEELMANPEKLHNLLLMRWKTVSVSLKKIYVLNGKR